LEEEDTPAVPIGERYYLPEFPLTHLWLASPGEPRLITDVATDERTDKYARNTYAEMGIQTTAIIPLTQAGRWVGLLSFHWRELHAFSEQEIALYSALIGLGSPAVESLRRVNNLERLVAERTAELQRSLEEGARLQQQVIETQKLAIRELSTPVIPIMDHIIVMPLIGSIDSMRARDITRALLAGIRTHQAKVVILDITGVPIVDSGVADHLNKTIQAAQLKGSQTIVTGISDVVAEAIVDLGIDWTGIKTLSDLQTGLIAALNSLGFRLTRFM
jgi:anti-anti-sigma regulatory factor